MSMKISHVQEVAKTILEQLYARRTEVWAWGAKDFMYLEREIEGEKHPALIFSIRTPKIMRGGRVIISLDEGMDEYIVEAIRISKGVEKIIGKETNVYFNELHNVINSLIEDKNTYAKVLF